MRKNLIFFKEIAIKFVNLVMTHIMINVNVSIENVEYAQKQVWNIIYVKNAMIFITKKKMILQIIMVG